MCFVFSISFSVIGGTDASWRLILRVGFFYFFFCHWWGAGLLVFPCSHDGRRAFSWHSAGIQLAFQAARLPIKFKSFELLLYGEKENTCVAL